MRLREFTNAEEQLGLLRRIIDSIWTAIADEAAEQKEQERQERLKASKKSRSQRAKTASSPRPPPLAPSMPPKLKTPPTAANSAVGGNAPVSNALVPPPQQTVSVANPASALLAGHAAKLVQSPATLSPLSPQPSIRPYDGRDLRKRYGLSI